MPNALAYLGAVHQDTPRLCAELGLRAFGDRVDLVGNESVCLAVHSGRGVGVWGVNQAEDRTMSLTNPVAQAVEAVPA